MFTETELKGVLMITKSELNKYLILLKKGKTSMLTIAGLNISNMGSSFRVSNKTNKYLMVTRDKKEVIEFIFKRIKEIENIK